VARILRKSLPLYLVTAWVAITLNFLIPRLMPGNPAEILMARLQRQGAVPLLSLQAMEAEFGVNTQAGWLSQYFAYLGHVIHLNLGVSVSYFPEPVSQVIASTLPWTLVLVTLGVGLSWVIGIALGAIVGWRRGSRLDNVLIPTSTFFTAVPFFVVGLLLVWILGIVLGWMPIDGAYGSTVTIGLNSAFILSWLQHAALPLFTIVVSSFVSHMLYMRNMMVTTLGDDYVRLAQAKGLSQRRIKYAYAGRNALLPSVASFAISLGFVVGGSVLVETVFAYPGIGYALYQAVNNEDYALMQGIFLIIVIAVLVANLCADLLYAVLDPRSRRQLTA
jgi:peptide/nickel transport system permease protein